MSKISYPSSTDAQGLYTSTNASAGVCSTSMAADSAERMSNKEVRYAKDSSTAVVVSK